VFLMYSIVIVSMHCIVKIVAFFNFQIPHIVIKFLIFDTILAIIRRAINNQGIATPDKKHIHYQLINMGYSHRASVLIIYVFSIFFGGMAIVFNSARLLTSLFLLGVIILGIQLIAEIAGITTYNRKPLLNGIRRMTGDNRKVE